MCQWRCVSFVLLLLSKVIFAQQRYMPHYTTANGLPSNTVYKVVKDSLDFLWIATSNGICRFDGQHFETFSLKGLVNDVEFIDISVGKNGRVWFVPFSGDVLLYDGVQFRNGKSFFGQEFTGVQQVYEDDFGCIWFTQQNNAIHKYNTKSHQLTYIKSKIGGRNTTILDVVSPRQVIINNNGTVAELFTQKKIISPNTLSTSFRPRNVLKLATEKYLYHDDKNILSYDKGIISVLEQNNIRPNDITFINNNNNQLWVGTNKGLFCYNFENNKLTYQTNVLSNQSITYTTTDREKNVWIGTYSDGLYCIPSQLSYQLPLSSSFNAEPWGITQFRGQLLVGLNKAGLQVIDPKKTTQILQPARRTYINLTSRIKRLRSVNNAVFMTHENALLRWNGQKLSTYFLNGSLKDYDVTDSLIFVASHASAMVLSQNELLNYESGQFKSDEEYLKKLNLQKSRRFFEGRTTAICFDKRNQNIWIGKPNGLALVSINKANQVLANNSANIPIPDTLPAVLQNFKYRVSGLVALPNGGIAIGTTAAGLFIFKDNQLTNISVDEGLSNNFVQSLFIDNRQNLWVCTINGLNKISLADMAQKQWKNTVYYEGNGLMTNIVNDVFVSNDSIWAATSGGVSFLLPTPVSVFNDSVPVRVTNLWADEKLVDYQPLKAITTNNSLKIAFYAISSFWGKELRFRYRLKGNGLGDKDVYSQWTTTDQHIALFKDLMPGIYKFEVEAITKERSLVLGHTELAVRLTMPFYQNPIIRYSFLAFLTVLLLLILFNYYYQRERKRRAFVEEFNELEKQAFRAQMNPHFVFNCLNAIQEFLVSNEPEQAQRYLAQFAKLIRKTLDFTKKNTVYLTDEIDYITLYTKLEQVRYEQPFRVEIVVAENIQKTEIEIPSLLLQPFIENAIRHGQLGKMKGNGLLRIDFEVLDKHLICTIDDNGVGINQSKAQKLDMEIPHTSYGLNIIKKRLELINQFSEKKSKFEVFDKQNLYEDSRGTRVVLTLAIY